MKITVGSNIYLQECPSTKWGARGGVGKQVQFDGGAIAW